MRQKKKALEEISNDKCKGDQKGESANRTKDRISEKGERRRDQEM